MKKHSIKHYFSSPRFFIGTVMVGAMLLILAISLVYIPHDTTAIDIGNKLSFFSPEHPLGTDQFGRDILSRIMKGLQISFLIGICATALGAIVGTSIGALAGYYGGKTDEILMKLIDTQMAFPGVLLALMLIAVFGNSLFNMILALGIMAIPRFARMSRSGFMKFREAEFIKAARARGANDARIIFLHIFPNITSELLVTMTLSFASAIMSEAGLSYLGLGIQPPNPSFGKMLSEAQGLMLQAPWYIFIPAAALTVLVMGFNLIADGLRDMEEK